MRVAILRQPGEIGLQERPRPEPSDDEVLVRVEACGVCTTDLHLFEGNLSVPLPLVPGHESAGEIVEMGSEVADSEQGDGLAVGDRVAINPSVPCHQCKYCDAGRENLCPDLTSIGGAADTVVDGSFAEFVVVPAGNVESIGDLSARQAAFAEPLGCCVHGIERLDVAAGDSVALVGAGPIGLLLVQLLDVEGVDPIVVSEPVDERRERALELGADYAVDPTEEDPVAEVHERVGPVDTAIEAVGAIPTLEQAWEMVGDGGTTLVFGVPPEDATFDVAPFDVFYDERTLLGTYSLTPADFRRAIQLLQDGGVDGEALVTHETSLSGLPDALERMQETEGLKQMVRP